MSNAKKRGRPKKRDAIKVQFGVKLNEGRIDKLIRLMEELDMSTSEVFRFALDKLYDETDFT